MGEKKNTSKNQPPPSEEDEHETRDNEGQGDGEKVEEVNEDSKEAAEWLAKHKGAKSKEHGVPKSKEQPEPEEKPKEEISVETPLLRGLEPKYAQLKKKLEKFIETADRTATEEARKLRQETNDFYTLLTGKFKTKPTAEEKVKLDSVWGKISPVVGKFYKKCKAVKIEIEEIEKKEKVSEEVPPPQKEEVATLEELAEQEKKRKKEEKKEEEERKKIKVELEGKIDVYLKEAAGKPPEIPPAGPPPPEGLPGGTPEKQPTPEAKKTPSEAIETHLRDLLNQTKILETFKDRKAECDKALKERKFALSDNLLKEKETKEAIDYLMKNAGKEKELDEKGKKEFQQKIKDLIEQTGLDEAQINDVVEQINLRKQKIVQQEILAAQRPTGWWSLAKAGAYGLTGAALRWSGHGITTGLVMAGIRSAELIHQEREENKALKDESGQRFNALQLRLEKGEDKGSKELREDFLQSFAGLVAITKQEQIDGKFQEIADAEKKFEKANNVYFTELKKKGKVVSGGSVDIQYQQAREAVFNILKERIKNVVDVDPAVQKLSNEQKEKIQAGIEALARLDHENTFFGQQIRAKNSPAFAKLEQIAAKLFGRPAGRTREEQIATTVAVAAVGALSHQMPVAADILLGYAGMQAAGLLADVGIAHLGKERYKLVRGVTDEEVKEMVKEMKDLKNPPDEFVQRAEMQLLDANFCTMKRAEYAKLRELVDQVRQKKLKQAEKASDAVGEHTKNLEDTYAKKRKLERGTKMIKTVSRITGAVLGVAFAELLQGLAVKAQAPKVTQEVMPVAPPVIEKPVISDILTAKKGDTVWGLIEKQLGAHYSDKFSHLNEAQKTYLIDALKDKVVAHPGAFGLEDAHHLVSGEKVDLTSLFRDETGLLKIFGKATHLTQDQVQNILDNNSLLRHVAQTPLKELSAEKLRDAIDIMGGPDLAPSSYVHALDQKLEAMKEITTISPEIAAKISAADKMYDVLRIDFRLSNFSLDHHGIMSEGTGTFFLVDPQYNEVPIAIKDWQINKIGDLLIDPPIKLVPGEPLPALLREQFLEQLWNARLAEAGIAQDKIWDIYDAAQNWMPKDLRGLSESAITDLKPDQLLALKSLAHFEALKDKLNLLSDGHRWNSAGDLLGQMKKEMSAFLDSPEGVWADGNRINKWLGKVGDLIQQGRELYPFAGADGMTVRAVDEILGGSGMNFRMSDIAGANVKELTKMTGTMEDLIGGFKSIAKDATKSLEMQEKAKEAGKWLTKFLRIVGERKNL